MTAGALDPRLLRRSSACRPYVLCSALLGVGAAACVLGQAVVLATAISSAFLDGARLPDLAGHLVALAALVLLRAGIAFARELTAARSAAAVTAQLRAALLRRATEPGPWRLGTTRTAELAELAGRGVDALEPYLARYLPQLLLCCVVVPLFLAAIWVVDPLSGLVVTLAVPLVPLLLWLVGSTTGARTRGQWRAAERLSAHFLDVVDGLPTLRAHGRARAQRASIAAVTDDYRRAALGALRLTFLSAFVLELAASLSVALVAVQVGLRLLADQIALAPALTVLLLAPEAFLPLRRLGASYHDAAEGLTTACRVLDLLDAPARRTGGTRPLDAHRGITLDGVAVRPGHDACPTPPVTLRVAPGEVVALTGDSGIGKSTLVAALLGFTAPERGTIAVGGVDLASADLGRWHAQLAWAPQRPTLLTGTIRGNVTLGLRPEEVDPAAVTRALRRAGACGLDPNRPVGEDGAGLSMGERQRVTLARAYLRAERGAAVLLLDEPTAHLDGPTEAAALAGLRDLAPGRCVLLVTHAPAAVAAADRVVAMVPATHRAEPAGLA